MIASCSAGLGDFQMNNIGVKSNDILYQVDMLICCIMLHVPLELSTNY